MHCDHVQEQFLELESDLRPVDRRCTKVSPHAKGILCLSADCRSTGEFCRGHFSRPPWYSSTETKTLGYRLSLIHSFISFIQEFIRRPFNKSTQRRPQPN